MSQPRYLGLEIGGTKYQWVLSDHEGQMLDSGRESIQATSGAEGILNQIQKTFSDLMQCSENQATIRGVGIGFGGPVNRREGRIEKSFHVTGWDGFPLADWVRSLYPHWMVELENDTNAAALAEAQFGAGKGQELVFYTNAGSGVGGGFVIRGELYHGRPPGEMELGHLRLSRGGPIVEDRCSGWSLDRRVQELHGEGGAAWLKEAVEREDWVGISILDDAATNYGYALSHVVHLLHPDVIVLGGGVSLLGEIWRSRVASALAQHLIDGMRPGPPVLLSGLGEWGVPLGVIALLLRRDSREKECE